MRTSAIRLTYLSLLTDYSNYLTLDEALALLYQPVKKQQNLETQQHSKSHF